jgi:hypothetical protein
LFVGDSINRYHYPTFLIGFRTTRFHLTYAMVRCRLWARKRLLQRGNNLCDITAWLFDNDLCDCFQPESRNNLPFTVENRFAFIAELNASVTYIQVFGYHNVKASTNPRYQNFPVADTVGTSTLKWDANHPYAFFYEEMIRLLLGYLKRPIDCKLLVCAG